MFEHNINPKPFDRYPYMTKPDIPAPVPYNSHPNLCGLSWDGFNITGNAKSIEEVKRLVEKERAQQVFKGAFIKEEE